jgi:hypothetical protein
MISKFVLVRDSRAGVFYGVCEALDLTAGPGTVQDARKVHYWTGAGAVEGVVARGPKVGSRITAKVTRVAGRTLVQIIECTPAERAVLEGLPEWQP